MAGFRGLCKKSFLLDLILLVVLLYLIYIFLEQNFEQIPERSFSANRLQALRRYDRYEVLLKPTDHRSIECSNIKYGQVQKITLISYFYNFQLYDLKIALSSALHGNEEHIGEVIIVDDGSNENSIVDDAEEYFNAHSSRIKLIRNDAQLGSAKSLRRALEEARYDGVVILDPSVICSVGWLLPLLHAIEVHPSTVAVPHFDKVSDSIAGKYDPIEDNYVAYVLWNLHTVFRKNDPADFVSPALRPDLLAAKRSFLNSIGSFDDGLNFGGGDALELGMKIWCCGGSIKVVNCSRVGVSNFHNPVKVTSGVNLRRIIGLWFLNSSHVFLPLSRNFRPLKGELNSIEDRKGKLFTTMKCKSAQWYFTEILKKSFTFDRNVTKFGYLRAMSGSCARVTSDNLIELAPCERNSETEDYIFQLTSDRRLLARGQCLAAMPNAYVAPTECTDIKRNKMWEFTSNFELVNMASGSCAKHVTDPNMTRPGRQVVMVQSCTPENNELEHFKRWTFIPV